MHVILLFALRGFDADLIYLSMDGLRIENSAIDNAEHLKG